MMKIRQNLTDWVKVAVLLLDEAVVIAGVLLLLNYFGLEIPLPLMIILGIVLGVFVLIVHVKVIPTFRRRQVTGRDRQHHGGALCESGREQPGQHLPGVLTVAEHADAIPQLGHVDHG